MTGKEEAIELEGTVVESLKGKFRVQIDGATPSGSDEQKHTVIAHLSGKMRKNFIKIVPGDRVKVEISAYDLTKGRITFRLKS